MQTSFVCEALECQRSTHQGALRFFSARDNREQETEPTKMTIPRPKSIPFTRVYQTRVSYFHVMRNSRRGCPTAAECSVHHDAARSLYAAEERVPRATNLGAHGLHGSKAGERNRCERSLAASCTYSFVCQRYVHEYQHAACVHTYNKQSSVYIDMNITRICTCTRSHDEA
jgi:hypothetical protein